jgi:hypothetical protein
MLKQACPKEMLNQIQHDILYYFKAFSEVLVNCLDITIKIGNINTNNLSPPPHLLPQGEEKLRE